MEDSEENMSSDDLKKTDSQSGVKKPKKRSLVERELETNLTARITSPASASDGLSTSRYGRARRLKTEAELVESQKVLLASIKSPGNEKASVKTKSPTYRMHASNTPQKAEAPINPPTLLESQIDNIYQENASLSRFSEENSTQSPAKKFPKVYTRKDLIQNREEDEPIMLISNLFSPESSSKSKTSLRVSLRSAEKYSKQNGNVDNSSVVKTLDFDDKKKKKDDKDKEQKKTLSKNELFELEAQCPYQVGDLAWARMGTFPFWPCIVTRDPQNDMFVKKKLFGRVEHHIIHVTFFGDNGRRSWVVDNMLRNYLGLPEFEATREKFTAEEKKKDPRLYAAFFISEKKQPLWKTSVEEAESLLREPKRLRIDIFNDMLWNARLSKKKSGKIMSRTNSDVSLSESLYDSLFSEAEEKSDDPVRLRNISRNKSFDVSEVVTACLDNMAAKTGITKIQRQSHMDRWLQKAKSNTPEKNQAKPVPVKVEKTEQNPLQDATTQPKLAVKQMKLNRKLGGKSAKSFTPPIAKPYRFRKRPVSNSTITQPAEVPTDTKAENVSHENENTDLTDEDGIIEITTPSNDAIITIDDDSSEVIFPEKNPVIPDSNKRTQDDSALNSIDESSTNNLGKTYNDSAMSVDDDDINVNQSKTHSNVESDDMKEDKSASFTSTHNKGNPKKKLEMETNKKTKNKSAKGKSDTKDPKSSEDEVVGKYNNLEIQKNRFNDGIVDQNAFVNRDVLDVTINDTHHRKDQYKDIVMKDEESTNMEVEDEVKKDIKIKENETEKSNQIHALNHSVVDVKGNTDCELQTNRNISPKSETVSNISVDHNTILMACSDLKDARNITIEVSVTERKDDDTLNNRLHEEQQGSIEKPNPSIDTVTNVHAFNFLEERNSHNENMALLLNPKNSSTPEKFEGHETLMTKLSNICTKKLHLDKITNVKTSNEVQNKLILSESYNKKRQEQSMQTQEDNIIDDSSILDDEDNLLNESAQSESILLSADDQIYRTDENKTDIMPNNLNIEESARDIDKRVGDNENQPSFSKDENNDGSTRHYVESPTFTQPQDSEEFFRVVSQPTISPKLDSKDNKKELDTVVYSLHQEKTDSKDVNSSPVQEQMTIMPSCGNSYHHDDLKQNSNPRKEGIKNLSKSENDKVSETFDEYSEETSDEEPSPAYESLDEEITEDFRKHFKSIESNIKDKKNDDQIVKICNEIAEKAKLSPTKYIPDEQVVKQVDTNLKGTPNLKNKHKNDIKLKIKLGTMPTDENHVKPGNKNSKILQGSKHQNVEFGSQHSNETNKRATRHTNLSKPTVNGNATYKEITDSNKSEIVYQTRKSLSNATKDASPDSSGLSVKASKIEHYRKSSEYAPKVILTRLQQDQWKCLNKPEANIHYSKGLKLCRSLSQDESSYDDTRTTPKKSSDAKLVASSEGNTKIKNSRLALKRSRRSKQLQLENQPESPKLSLVQDPLKTQKVEMPMASQSKMTLTPTEDKDEDTPNIDPRIRNVTNISNETRIPESVKINGYHLEVNRKITATPDSCDTDFDIDAVSLNSEDSEISLSNSEKSIPVRNLRSRPERTLDNALKNPEFLNYLELKQDYLMDEHSELNEEEILMYVYKTWQYEEDLKSDVKKVEEARHSNFSKSVKNQDTPRSNKKKSQPKNIINNYFHEKYEKSRKTIDFAAESGSSISDTNNTSDSFKTEEKKKEPQAVIMVQTKLEEKFVTNDVPKQTRPKSPECIDFISDSVNEISQDNNAIDIKDNVSHVNDTSASNLPEENITPKRSSRRSHKRLTPTYMEKEINDVHADALKNNMKKEKDADTESVNSENSEVPIRKLRSKLITTTVSNDVHEIRPEQKDDFMKSKESSPNDKVKEEIEEIASTVSGNEPLVKQKKKKAEANSTADPEFLNYLKLKQDALMDENPLLTQDEIVSYLHKTWLYEESSKSELVKNSELDEANLLKGLNSNEAGPTKKVKKRTKVEKQIDDQTEIIPKEKPRRRIAQPFYNENYSDIEEELELFDIFKTKKTPVTVVTKVDTEKDKIKSPPTKSIKVTNQINKTENRTSEEIQNTVEDEHVVEYSDDTEIYFTDLTKPKPNVFKGLAREKVCEICEYAGPLVKCKGCHGMFHPDCVKRQQEAREKEKTIEAPRGRKKKIKKAARKTKSFEESGSQSDEKQDLSADVSIEDIKVPDIAFDAETFESQLELKMKEMLNTPDVNYDSYSSDDGIDWQDSEAGKCEIIDVKWKRRDAPIDYSDFKCINCQKYDVPICFVCKNAVSKTGVKRRQKCHVAHCHKHFHLECLDQWPQTHFHSGEPSRHKKKISEHFEALTCPRHVCHTCVSDDPRGCKTRFSGDKLAKCVRCPATYHSFNKCLPAGSQILTASHIICPRHCDQRPGKVPCHVNTGWCFICALGGSLICCEYCPTSFHAECLNIKPPEGNYMCEDCETGRLPLYGEMVWVKLGHYRWWPGIILHPSEIPDNIMAVKHEPGDFVVRFFGQYDHYWVNRGRVFPYQEGDSGRISSQKSKINEDFICAMEHAQRAYDILKNAEPDEEEVLDIESSLLPPQYVKLKTNKPCGSLCGKRTEDPSLSLTQCECDPNESDPCGPYSQCLNRMLLTECGPTCRAGERCMNRAFEKRQYPKLVPYRTPHRGWGLKTLDSIKAGQFVIEYVGELIDEEEYRRRMRRKHEIRDENFYFLTLDKERMIDAGPKGNVARFMNHCCEPNCETQKWTVLGDVRVGLFAIDDIPANSEVTFNYNLECAGIEKKRCLCGAKRCSGYIGAKPKQDESQTKKIKRTYNKKKKPEESPSAKKIKTKRLGRTSKPKELTELEKDVLIIKSATSSISSDDSYKTLSEDKTPLKTKRVSDATDETTLSNCQEGLEEKNSKPLRKKSEATGTTDENPISNEQDSNSEDNNVARVLKRKRVSITTEEVSLCNGLEPNVKKFKCEENPSEVGD